MKVDQDIIQQSLKEGMPQKPMSENSPKEEEFEE